MAGFDQRGNAGFLDTYKVPRRPLGSAGPYDVPRKTYQGPRKKMSPTAYLPVGQRKGLVGLLSGYDIKRR